MRLMVGSYSDNCYQKIGGRSSQSMMKEAVAKSTSFVAVPRSTSSNEVIANFFLSWSNLVHFNRCSSLSIASVLHLSQCRDWLSLLKLFFSFSILVRKRNIAAACL